MTTEEKAGRRVVLRMMLTQAAYVALSWFSLTYGWGIAPHRWGVLLGYFAIVVPTVPLCVLWTYNPVRKDGGK